MKAAAVAIAARELDEADVGSTPGGRRAAREPEARERYVRLRVGALLAADLSDRTAAQGEVLRHAEAWRQSPAGRRADREALSTALAGWLPRPLLHVGALPAILGLTLWQAA